MGKKVRFFWWRERGVTTLIFNGYQYKTYDQYLADRIIRTGHRRPGRAWNIAKQNIELSTTKESVK